MQEPDTNLQELLDELANLRSSQQDGRAQHYERILPDAHKLERVPLVHGSPKMETLDVVVRDGALLSRTARGLPQNKPEQYLEIEDKVYTAAGILYPDARVAFVFDARVERPGTTASPWDSGAFVKQLCPDLPPPPDLERRRIFARYCVPAPQYREYLVCYVASCYRRPSDYLSPERPVAFPDPLGAISDGKPSRSFEVRIPGRIDVTDATLLAVFFVHIKGTGPNRQSSAWLSGMQRSGVTVEPCRTMGWLEKRVRDWIASRLGYGDS